MKKTLFISVIALAAAISCTKSEVVDSKFGKEQIGFETYLGKDAATKASVESINTIGTVGVYGYYLGATDSYDAATSDANLWNPLTLVVNEQGVAQQPTGNDIRYWTNATDYYAFLAYAPKDEVSVTAGTNGENPTISYADNVDILCAEPQTSRTKGDGTVNLKLEHKLARITVKARATAGNFDYHIKSISIKGTFYTEGKLPLASPNNWINLTSTANTEYTFPTVAADALPKPATTGQTVDYKDYAGTDNYHMVIPVVASQHAAQLTVVYSTSYMAGDRKIESVDYTKSFTINNDFEMGNAYAISLEFVQATDNQINFSVSETQWTEQDISMTL